MKVSGIPEPQGKFPIVKLRGAPGQIGNQHGVLLRSRIVSVFQFYRNLFRDTSDSQLRDLSEYYRKEIRGFSPEYEEEIVGISEGSGIEVWKLFMLNARTEIYHHLQISGRECTSLYFKESRLLGQNWDWARELEDLAVILEIEKEDGHKILTVTEPGIIAKIGLNSRGIGVCLNILPRVGDPGGVPVHLLLRAVLDSPSLAVAEERIGKARHRTMSNLLLGDSDGRAVSLELYAGELRRLSPRQDLIFHTNHYLAGDLPNPESIPVDSTARYERMEFLLSTNSSRDRETMGEILRDSQGGGNAICSRYGHDSFFGFTAGTVCSVMMDLPSRVLYYTPGSPLHNGFHSHQLI